MNEFALNILLTCAGRRNYLVGYFKDALAGIGKVMAADVSDSAPAMQEADCAFTVPRVDAANYIESLLEICRRHQIKLLISLNDLELPILAREKTRFEKIGTRLAVSDADVIDIAFDKWRSMEFLRSCGLPAPVTSPDLDTATSMLEAGKLAFPLVVKPRWGTASIGIELVFDRHELKLAYTLIHQRLSRSILADVSATDEAHCVMIQECLSGPEFGLDVINDLSGKYVTTWVKQKLTMRAGETDQAVTVDNSELRELGAVVGRNLKHVGNLDCDVFMTPTGPRVLELNPRFGGGYPFSHMAGANLPAAMVAWINEKALNPDWLTIAYGVCSAKCDRLVYKRDIQGSGSSS